MKKLKVLFPLAFAAVASVAQVPEQAEDISPLLIGEQLPNAELYTLSNKTIELQNVLKEKPSVIVIYRGGWCPFCNLQLSGLASIQKDIQDLGYQIIAISPDNVTDLNKTQDKENFKYQLLSDPEGHFIKNIGIAFKTNTMTKEYVNSKGRSVTDILPVPTVMVVNQKGEILFEYINPNYKQRISSEMLLAVLQTIKN